MPSEEYIESVEEMFAEQVASEAASLVTELAGATRDPAEQIIYRAILAAFELARKQVASPRVGTMTFNQAMEAIKEGEMVTRPSWGILRALLSWGEDHISSGYRYNGMAIHDFALDNLDGNSTGSGTSYYCPSEEDLAATDWMVYRKPQDFSIDINAPEY